MSIVKKSRMRELSIDFLAYLIGSGLDAIAVNTFSAPNNIAPGGVTGLSIIVNYATQAPIGTVIFLLNIPLFLLGLYFIGWKFIAKTVLATFMMSAVIDVTAPFIPGLSGGYHPGSPFRRRSRWLGTWVGFAARSYHGRKRFSSPVIGSKIPSSVVR